MITHLKTICFFLSLFCGIISHSQTDSFFSRKGKTVSFKVLKTNDENLSINDILKKPDVFKSPSSFNEKTNPEDTYWIRIDLNTEIPNLSKDSIWYLRFRLFEYSTLFYANNKKIEEHKFGNFEDKPDQPSLLYYPGIKFTKDMLISNRYLYLKVRRAIGFDNISNWKFIYASEQQNILIEDYYSKSNVQTLIPIYLFSGICLVMFLFTLAFFIYSKKLEFIYYALYVLGLFLYLTPDIIKLHDAFFGGFSLLSYSFFHSTQVLINLLYMLFVMHYLNTTTIYPKLHKPLKVVVVFLGISLILGVLSILSEYFKFNSYLLNLERLVGSVFGLAGMVYLLLKGKSKLIYFVVIGSFLYLAGALGFFFFGKRIFMILGSTLEMIVFAAGLAYKIQKEYQEKVTLQKEAFLNKQKALRAQINPHFIFNSLSSIQHLVTKNDRVSALRYLSKFSRLTRNILESSIETNVVLADEIKMLKDYLELESLRFDNAFSYSISLDDNLDANTIEIPFMLLQPFVENAIIHGLLPKEGNDKTLKISFKKESDIVICEVEDNGVGRAVAADKTHIHKREKKSRGLQVTKQRLETLGLTSEPLKIIDKTGIKNQSLGTKVIIKIPLK